MMAFYLLKKPFKSLFKAIQQIIYELIILIVTINVMILAMMESNDTIDLDTSDIIGKTIIMCNICFNFLAFDFLLVKIGETMFSVYKSYRARQKVKVEVVKPNVLDESTFSNLVETRKDLTYINTLQNISLPYSSSNKPRTLPQDNYSSEISREKL